MEALFRVKRKITTTLSHFTCLNYNSFPGIVVNEIKNTHTIKRRKHIANVIKDVKQNYPIGNQIIQLT
jgi:hypothetical protein